MQKKRTRLFYKYLLSYFVIFLIPFTVISILFYQTSVQNLRDEIVQSNTDKIEQVKDFTDSRIDELTQIANRISMDNRLTPFMFSESYHSKKAVEELVSYKVNSAMIDELYIYFQGRDQIYSPRGSSSMKTFVKKGYPFAPGEGDEFKDKIKAGTAPDIKPFALKTNHDKEEKIITYFYPIPANSAVTYGTVAFVIQEKAIKKMIEKTLGEFNGNVYVFNGDHALLASSNQGEKLDKGMVKQLAKGKPGLENTTIHDEAYSVVTVQSDVSNWKFVTTLPSAQFYGKMTHLKTSIILILFAIAFIGVITVIYMSLNQYKPIQNIIRSLKSNRVTEPPDSKNHNELEDIHRTIEHMHKDSEQLQKKLAIHQPFIRDQLLVLLLKGDLHQTGEIPSMLKEMNMMMRHRYFFTMIVSLKHHSVSDRSILNRERLLNLLTTISSKLGVGYGVELIHENTIAVIVNLDSSEENHTVLQSQFMEHINKQLMLASNHQPIIGVGKVYGGINWINRSFIEANVALEHHILNRNRPITYFENLTQHHDEVAWYPVNDQSTFIQSLKQGNQVVARESLKTIITSLSNHDTSIHMLKAMCFDLINTILKTGQELELRIPTDLVKRLVQFKSLDDLEDTIHVIIHLVCYEIEQRKVSHNNDLRDNILAYIHQQFTAHELSLEFVAAHFQVSTSYLSRFMKEQTGETFTQYVWKLRNQEFKRQLKESNRPIKEIVLEIGYIDVANFIRKFKKSEGITPGDFRRLY
jgi:YesN/AraC family two-component response regulator